MVKKRKNNNRKKPVGKGIHKKQDRPRKINASTQYGTCSEQISPFGGLLALIKFIDLIGFRQIFEDTYKKPVRKPKLGHYSMVVGILMLLFIGFNRIWHFTYLKLDALMCGYFKLKSLPVASTFWRYVDSLGINQGKSFLNIMHLLRDRFWNLNNTSYYQVHIDFDTTVKTLFGNQQGGRKGHNTKHRGKKGYRPVLGFIAETREYLTGKLRKGTTMSGKDAAFLINQIQSGLPSSVKKVILRADGEFFSWESVQASMKHGYHFIFANKKGKPPFDPESWYRPSKRKDIEYNSCVYTPIGWKSSCRFVAMRFTIKEKQTSGQPVQNVLFEDDKHTYRIFCTSLRRKAHKVIKEYDKRADTENLIGESKREGLDAVPSSRFKSNYAFFQIVMLAYNIWRYMKILAHQSMDFEESEYLSDSKPDLKGIVSNTIRIARLRMLFIAAKVVLDSNVAKVKYSIHDSRTPAMLYFLKYLDIIRSKIGPKGDGNSKQYCLT